MQHHNALQANLNVHFTVYCKERDTGSKTDGCYNVTMVLVLQMAILVENYDVTMVLVLQMASTGGKILRKHCEIKMGHTPISFEGVCYIYPVA